eukprot:TRINITY_DN2848_c0_g1_i3.p1 TRINITY_DN2848_c0_g1~~TRINITY_DN2848_c0_g1_i3.p1  ORF type:complete len:786 (-),score=346.74 TRINITY_DN2848_c0_g1_i3:166-2523(-)
MASNQKRKKEPTKPANTHAGGSATKQGNTNANKTARKDSSGSLNQSSEKVATPKSNAPSFEELNKKSQQLLFERTLWLTMNLVGQVVEVHTKSDGIYEGILHTATTDRGMGVALKFAKKKEKDGTVKSDVRPIENFVIYPNEFVQLIAKDVAIDTRFKSERDFGTDSEISGFGTTLKERELQPWIPSDGKDLESFSLDGPSAAKERKNWDQFEANRNLFGVETSWDENHYTIPLDRKSAAYKSKAGEAARIADEIERGITSNPHLAEERGQQGNNEEIDEEDRYSSVLRDQSGITLESKGSNKNTKDNGRQGGKYVPPHQRSGSNPPLVAGSLEEKPEKEEEKTEKTEKPVTVQPVKPKGSQLRRYDSLHDASSTGHHHSTLSLRASADHAGQLNQISPSRSPHPSPELLVTERLRLRSSLVEERFKNKAPTPNDQFNTPHRSPLMSPLVNNIAALNALSLHPAIPQLPDEVVRDFLNFSLTQKTNRSTEEKKKTIDNLKDFSKSLEKKVTTTETPVKESKAPEKKSTENLKEFSKSLEKKVPTPEKKETAEGKKEVPVKSSGKEDANKKPATKESKVEAKKEPETKKETKVAEAKSETKPAADKTSKPAETKPATVEATKSTESKPAASTDESKSKLNPSAKPFKPMSAASAAFVPAPSAVVHAPPVYPIYMDPNFVPFDPNMMGMYPPPEGFAAGRGQGFYPYPPPFVAGQPGFPPGSFPNYGPSYPGPFPPGGAPAGQPFPKGQFNPNAGGFVPAGRGAPMGGPYPYYPPSIQYEEGAPEGN